MTDPKSRLTAATGYMELQMYQDAYTELEELPAHEKTAREVLELKVEILHKLESWNLAREVSKFLSDTSPENSQYVIWKAYATRRISGIREAEKVLLGAIVAHENDPIIHYNLACYAAQLGRIDEAKTSLTKAIEIDPNVRQMILDDPDLEPLWESWVVKD